MRDFRSITLHFEVWSQSATTPECLFKLGDRLSEKKRQSSVRRAICNATRGIDAGRGVIRHHGVSDGSDWARALWRSHSAQTEMFCADAAQTVSSYDCADTYVLIHSQIGVIEPWACQWTWVLSCCLVPGLTPETPFVSKFGAFLDDSQSCSVLLQYTYRHLFAIVQTRFIFWSSLRCPCSRTDHPAAWCTCRYTGHP